MIQVSDSEDELDKSSSFRTSRFVVVCAVISSREEEEEEEMSLTGKKGLRDLLMDRAKGSVPKDTSRSYPSLTLLPPLPPPVNLFALTN